MWCRVLLVVIALTCTFQREIIEEPDDVICVILLSGLQKEDLDVNLLKKLQRHNVNIDDMNNEKTIEKCILSSTSGSPTQNVTLPAEKLVPTVNTEHSRSKVTRTKPSIHNLISLWKMFNDTQSQQDEDPVIIRKNMGIPTTITETKADSQRNDVNYINKLFKRYIAAKQEHTTTQPPITNQKHYDAISQQVKDFLEHTNLYYNRPTLTSKPFEDGYGYVYKLHNIDDDNTLLSKERKKEVTKINLTMQMPYTVKKETKADSQSKDQSYINKIFERYIAAKHTTTQKPTTTQKHIDVSQQIKVFLETNNMYYKKDAPEIYKTEQAFDNESHDTDEDVNKGAKSDIPARDLDYINKIFRSYIAANRDYTSTLKPTTAQIPIDTIAQQIRQFLENKKIFNNDASVDHVYVALKNGNTNKPQHIDDEPTLSRKSATIRYIDELLTRKNLFNISSISDNKTQGALPVNYSQIEPKIVSQENNKQNLVPDKIIREIADEIKASVLKDIKKQISTFETTTKNYIKVTTIPNVEQSKTDNATTILENLKELFRQFKKGILIENTTQMTYTNTSSQTDQDKFKDVSSALENFMELFQNLDKDKKSIVVPGRLKYTLTQRKKTNNEFHGPINVLYPSLMPVNYAYGVNPESVSVIPILVDPYNRVVQINNPMLQRTNVPKQVNRDLNAKIQFDGLSNFNINPLHNIGKIEMPTMRFVPIIQTDAIEVPPLGIPVSKTIRAINQNIVLATQHPIVKSKNEQQHRNYAKEHNNNYIVHDDTYNTDTISESGIDRRQTDVERSYEKKQAYSQHGRTAEKRMERERKQPRNKHSTAIDGFYREYLTNIKPHINRDYLLSTNRNGERFHEKLERQNNWQEKPKHYRELQDNTTKNDKRYGIISRQQVSLNELKKKASSDDSHFNNFLKTQQKVNDMLEKILATKGPERARSVETPDTMNAFVN